MEVQHPVRAALAPLLRGPAGLLEGFGAYWVLLARAFNLPRDLRPFDPMRFSLNLTQILSSLAISAGALAVISNN